METLKLLNRLATAFNDYFAKLLKTQEDLMIEMREFFQRTDNPHQVNKVQVGLGDLPNATTSSRTENTVEKLLTAKGMYDHSQSSDHDSRYYTKQQVNQSLQNLEQLVQNGDQAVQTAVQQVEQNLTQEVNGVKTALQTTDTTVADHGQAINALQQAVQGTVKSASITGIEVVTEATYPSDPDPSVLYIVVEG